MKQTGHNRAAMIRCALKRNTKEDSILATARMNPGLNFS